MDSCPAASTAEVVLVNLPQSLLAIATLLYAARAFWTSLKVKDRLEHLPCEQMFEPGPRARDAAEHRSTWP